VNAIMARQAIVTAFMQTALDAEEVAGSTLRPAKLDAGSEIYDSTVKCSAQLFDAGIPGLESLCIRLQPLIDSSCAQVNKVSQILRKIGNPFRVVDVLPGIGLVPGLTESLKTKFAVCHWSIWTC
jgi:hypothetical protein